MISICIPYIRPEKMLTLEKTIIANAGTSDIEILTHYDEERIGCPKVLKMLVEKSRYEYIVFLGDDTDPQKDFLKNALKDMEILRGNGLIGFNDQTGRTLPTHWLASKKLLNVLDGEFFCTKYLHCFCDSELMLRADFLNKFIYSYDSVVLHNHPLLNGSASDKDYQWAYSPEVYNHDRILFEKRKANNWR